MVQSVHEISACVHIVVDQIRTASPSYFNCLSGYQWDTLRSKILRAGLTLDQVRIISLENLADSKILDTHARSLIVGMGERVLNHFMGKKSIDKWHLSPLVAQDGTPFVGTFDFGRLQAQYELHLYLEMTLIRAKEMLDGKITTPVERFHLNPGIEESIEILRSLKQKEEISIDIETGYGQINTLGLAWSPNDAIAINVLPDRCSDLSYFELWRTIEDVLKQDSRKILQNFIYDCSYLSAYGIDVRGEIFDTMWAMKVLWPEFKAGLDNVGRFYTKRSYWKDDGKVSDEEGAKKDWGNIRDWHRHYLYNCRDTTGTFEASLEQRKDLTARGLDSFFAGYMQRLTDPIREMCAVGMPVNLATRARLKAETESRLETLTRRFQEESGKEINPRSPKQVLEYVKTLGVSVPKKFDKKTKTYKESADAASIKKIRLKLPENKALAILQEFKTTDKALSSYIDFAIRPDSRLSYSLNGAGTESLRWSGSKDPWDRGINIQTIPREGSDVSIKSMFEAPEGFTFCEIDLRQAESRFVAYDSADNTLIEMLEANEDIHTHVGNAILRQMGRDPASVPTEEFKSTWRQLGKKAGHGLNYGMKASVFVETVFNELDMVITKNDAEMITEAYFSLFPNIRRWQHSIKKELYEKRKLTAPSGWERYFYGRLDDAYKEALSWRAQHTIPWITNHLMLHLKEQRKKGLLGFKLVAQVHDSLILLVKESSLGRVVIEAEQTPWHPLITLSGGKLKIPVEAKAGKVLSEVKEVQS